MFYYIEFDHHHSHPHNYSIEIKQIKMWKESASGIGQDDLYYGHRISTMYARGELFWNVPLLF